MTGYFALAPRPMHADDAVPARVLLTAALGVTPYVDRALELLAAAERGVDPEARAFVVERDGTVAGLALYGMISGSEGAARLHTVILAPGVGADVGTRLVDAVADAVRAAGARFLLAEMPDDAAVGGMLALLREHGLREEARVPDFYRDGVDLMFLRLSLRPA